MHKPAHAGMLVVGTIVAAIGVGVLLTPVPALAQINCCFGEAWEEWSENATATIIFCMDWCEGFGQICEAEPSCANCSVNFGCFGGEV